MARFCSQCREPLLENAKFCAQCGKPAEVAARAAVVPNAPVSAVPPSPATSTASSTPAASSATVRPKRPEPIRMPPRPQFTSPLPPPIRDSSNPPANVPSEVPGRQPSRKNVMAWMPIIVILALIIGLAVWAGVFGGRADKTVSRAQQPAPAVVNEQDGASTATITEVREPAATIEETSSVPSAALPAGVTATTQTSSPPIATTQPAAPPVTSSQPRAVPSTTQPPPRTVADERPVSRPTAPHPAPPRQTAAAPRPAPAPSREISEDDAMNVLRGYIIARNYYPVDRNCFHVVSLGYKNVGYTLDVVDRCGNRGRLGRWRVDSKTREVFRQQGDGRFLRP